MQYAFVDESEPNGTGHGGPYVMVATMPLTADLDDIRQQLRRLKPKSQPKLHWYDSVHDLRSQTISLVSELPLMHWAVIMDPVGLESPERRRRNCMERLFWEVSELKAVEQVIMESRGAADDKRDMEMVASLRAKKAVKGHLRVDHLRGPAEPLLWLPDAVCGALNARLLGDRQWCDMLRRQLWVVDP
jgi:hypothetical protein